MFSMFKNSMSPLDFLLYELSRGSFAKVMLSTIKGKNTMFAVKIMKKDPNLVTGIIQTENRVLQLAERSPFICSGLALFQIQSHVYFVMDYMSGGSLDTVVEMRGFLDMHIVLLCSAMACGLHFLHSYGAVHSWIIFS
ncbi:protein kinase C delta type-like [Discoglossus pictus]